MSDFKLCDTQILVQLFKSFFLLPLLRASDMRTLLKDAACTVSLSPYCGYMCTCAVGCTKTVSLQAWFPSRYLKSCQICNFLNMHHTAMRLPDLVSHKYTMYTQPCRHTPDKAYIYSQDRIMSSKRSIWSICFWSKMCYFCKVIVSSQGHPLWQRCAETHPMHTTASAAATKIDYYCLTVSHEHLDLCPHITLSLSLCWS